MSRQPGYLMAVRIFIPAPKNDFKAQAVAADLAHNLKETKALSPELIAVAKVIDVKGAYGSMAEEEASAPEALPELASTDPIPMTASKRKPPTAA